MASRNPSIWVDYNRGGSPQRSGSDASLGHRSVQFESEPLLGHSVDDRHGEQDEEWPQVRRRRSSVTNRLATITDIGGVNSIRSFTKSWARAVGFQEVIPQRPAFVFAADHEPLGAPQDQIQYRRSHIASSPPQPRTSLLRQHFEASPPEPSAIQDESTAGASHAQHERPRQPSGDYRDQEAKALDADLSEAFRVGSHRGSVFAVPPHLATPTISGTGLYGSYRAGYGTVRSDVSPPSMEHAGALWRQQQDAGTNVPDGECEPILVKEVEQDGKIMLTVDGQSTLPQTVFNSINVLIGVGLLSLPMGIKYAGWLCGMTILFLCAVVTAYTAKLLAKCMDLDPSLITFSDLAFISFGRNARIATSFLFTLELLAACVALIVLFADTLDLLFPGLLTLNEWKVLFSLVMVPLNFLPLRFLSFTSIIGILSVFSIVLILLSDGLIKPTSPGSLIEPAKTYLFPENWLTLPLSFGLLMSPWGGHSVFPNIYRDMRHPYRYPQAVKITFSFTYVLDSVMAIAGLLMFGDGVLDEITSNIIKTSGYPRILTFLMCVFVGIMPLTKIPLNARPIITTAEVLLGLHQQVISDNISLVGRSALFRGSMKVVIRILVIFCFLVIAVLFPAFDSIMAFMGSALCFTICVILPLCFYLKLFGESITGLERASIYALLAASIALSITGTVFSFLPRSVLE